MSDQTHSNQPVNHEIILHGRTFKVMLTAEQIANGVARVAREIRDAYHDRNPIFIGVLTGGAIFTADLVRACGLPCELNFVKLSSYEGMESTGQVRLVLPPPPDVENRHIILVEDIVDTGRTLHFFLPLLREHRPASVALATLLQKPDALRFPLEVDYKAFDIPDKFVVGYGLDYNQEGRHLPDLYELAVGE
jgi:hypoxanthine phosphoribosyltransferase